MRRQKLKLSLFVVVVENNGCREQSSVREFWITLFFSLLNHGGEK